jgi:hypothetical protein
MRSSVLLAALSAAVGVFGAATQSHAFCRTTTCDPATERCVADSTGCVHAGLPLVWPERCLSFGVQQAGSPLRRISYEAATQVIQDAFRQWLNAKCGGEPPSFQVWDVGEPHGGIVCDQPEFNQNEPNANVWMFRDEAWPYTGQNSTLALTTITFEVPTGEILDADVEVNSHSIPISTGDRVIENDLQSIATHEAGHFLGLAHSNDDQATMNANYSPNTVDFRSLHVDDIRGICAVYPPDRDAPNCTSPRPRHGFSRFCGVPSNRGNGCAVEPERGTAGTTGPSLLALAAATVLARRRRRGSLAA